MSLKDETLVTAEGLSLLKEVLNELQIQNYNIDVSPAIPKGQNFLGVIARTQVNGYDSEGKKVQMSFILKSAPKNEEYRKLGFVKDCYDREIYVYSELLPHFQMIQSEKHIIEPFKSYPKFYKSLSKYCSEALIIQDLKHEGYKHYNRKKFIDSEHMYLLLQEVGKFHALSYATRFYKPDLFKNIIKNTNEVSLQNFGTEFIKTIIGYRIKLALKSLDRNVDTNLYDNFKQFTENMFKIIPKCIDPQLIDEYAVVHHGDCGIGNYMFKYDDSTHPEKPTEVCFLDWQTARIGSPALDLSSILFSVTDKRFREEQYHNCINHYYKSLCFMLEKFGCDDKKLLPYNILLCHLKKYSIFGLFWAILLIYVQLQISEQDENSDLASTSYQLNSIQLFNERVKDLIMDFEKLGYNFEWLDN